jgi:hypothetical protein
MSIINIIRNKLYFKIAYLILAIIFVSIIGEITIIPKIYSRIMLVWGTVLILLDIIEKRILNNIVYKIPLLIFLIIEFVSMIYNKAFGDIKYILVNFILFFVIFDLDDKSIERIKGEMLKISMTFIIITMALTAGELVMMFTKTIITIGENVYGYIDQTNRGLFQNENGMGIISALSILITILLFNLTKNNKKIMALGVINILMQVYIVFISKATSGQLSLFVFLGIFIFFMVKNKYFKIIYSIIGIGGIVFFLNKIIESKRYITMLNGRYDLWVNAIDVSKRNLILGVSSSKFVEVMKANSKVDLWGIETGGIHNIFIQVLTVNGMISLIILIVFILLCFYVSVNYLKNREINKDTILNTSIFSFVAAIIFINCFESNLIYIVSFISLLSWIFLAYGILIIIKSK